MELLNNVPFILASCLMSSFLVETSSLAVVHSSLTEFKDDGLDVIFPNTSDIQYQRCKESSGFVDCQKFENYPSNFMRRLVLQNGAHGLFNWCKNKPYNKTKTKTTMPKTETILPEKNKTNLCSNMSSVAVVRPHGVFIDGKFHYVFQAETDDKECYQELKVVLCHDPVTSSQTCHYGTLVEFPGFIFKCVQKFVPRKELMVLNEKKELEKVDILIPSCCSCEYNH